MTTWRQKKLAAYARADRFSVPPRKSSGTASRQQHARTRSSEYSSEAEWSGSRLLSGHSKVRFLPLELLVRACTNAFIAFALISSDERHSSCSRRRASTCLPSRDRDAAHREHPALAARMVEHPPRKREDPVRFRTWALFRLRSPSFIVFKTPVQLDRSSTRFVPGRIRFDSGRGLSCSRHLVVQDLRLSSGRYRFDSDREYQHSSSNPMTSYEDTK
jgi:hypothetical protein